MHFGHIQLGSLGYVARSRISCQVLEARDDFKGIHRLFQAQGMPECIFISTYFHSLHFIYCVCSTCVCVTRVCMCVCVTRVCVCVCICHSMCVEARGQLGGN